MKTASCRLLADLPEVCLATTEVYLQVNRLRLGDNVNQVWQFVIMLANHRQRVFR
ncbi:MAG: hypothetical protein KDA66_09445 [Planctomycetaceae bacterium]|nr:hypothetical protein [Planctomycetaceae bacterium]